MDKPIHEPDLLPLRDWMECLGEANAEDIRDYARACVEANTGILEVKMETWKAKAIFHVELSEALRAEVERLTEYVQGWEQNFRAEKARAERLAEALRHAKTWHLAVEGFCTGSSPERREVWQRQMDRIEAALEQEGGRG